MAANPKKPPNKTKNPSTPGKENDQFIKLSEKLLNGPKAKQMMPT